MINSTLFILSAIPAILYKRASLRKLYENYVKFGMTLPELTGALNIKPALITTTGRETDNLVEIFEYESDKIEKYIMVFINGKLDKWYTEFKRSKEE